jgi:Na+/H+ antiporter NhaD/arsenite permease-like protein
MIVLGIILFLIGLFVQSTISPLLTTLGVILIVVGVVMSILGRIGRPVAGRRYWY